MAKTPKRLSPKARSNLTEDIKQGATAQALMSKYGISRATVDYHRKRVRVPPAGPGSNGTTQIRTENRLLRELVIDLVLELRQRS